MTGTIMKGYTLDMKGFFLKTRILLYSWLPTRSYPKNLTDLNFILFNFKIWWIWADFFHAKSFVKVEVIFFSSKFDEISPTTNKNAPLHVPVLHFSFARLARLLFQLGNSMRTGNNWTLQSWRCNSLNQSRDRPNAQPFQAGVIILYEGFSHQNVYEYIGLMLMHTCLKRQKRNSSLQLTLEDEGVKNEIRNIKKPNLYLTNFLKKCLYIYIYLCISDFS
jgi:hypothetical protein